MTQLARHPDIDAAMAAGGVISYSVSGGKDSDALVLACERELAGHPGPRVLIHSDLGRTEWAESLPQCQRLADRVGLELITVRRKSGGMMERWLQRWHDNCVRYASLSTVTLILPWSTASMRFCTSELKTAIICRELVQRFPGQTIINALGIRADESPGRAKAPVSKVQNLLTSKTHQTSGYTWLPIHHWSEQAVWDLHEQTGFAPHEAYTTYGMNRVSCVFCLAGETEVVTRDGIQPIEALAGTRPQVLIPKRTPWGLSGDGHFTEVEVRDFGTQRLWRIDMHRGRAKKTVYATAEHRWLLEQRTGSRSTDKTTVDRTTQQLVPGDRFRALWAQSTGSAIQVPFAVAQGFVFGDGSKGDDQRPATLTIYDPIKEAAMLPFFAAHVIKPTIGNGKPAIRINGLPRAWKSAPDYTESRSFLLSWLSGYFAADGCVTPTATARMDSASLDAIQIVRDIAAICGIGYGPIRTTRRMGIDKKMSVFYSVSLDVSDLPEWFFLKANHRERIATRGQQPDRSWTVDEVSLTNREETVYCAVVPDVHAFALSDGLMTGNCILSSKADMANAATAAQNADIYREMVDLEIASTFAFQDAGWLGDVAPQLLSDAQRDGLDNAKKRATLRQRAEARIPKHLLYDGKGWPRVMPTFAEAEMLAEVRSEVAQLIGLDISYQTANAILMRYAELMANRPAGTTSVLVQESML